MSTEDEAGEIPAAKSIFSTQQQINRAATQAGLEDKEDIGTLMGSMNEWEMQFQEREQREPTDRERQEKADELAVERLVNGARIPFFNDKRVRTGVDEPRIGNIDPDIATAILPLYGEKVDRETLISDVAKAEQVFQREGLTPTPERYRAWIERERKSAD